MADLNFLTYLLLMSLVFTIHEKNLYIYSEKVFSFVLNINYIYTTFKMFYKIQTKQLVRGAATKVVGTIPSYAWFFVSQTSFFR